MPEPGIRSGGLLVANVCSLISAGTEKSTVNVARKNLLGKAMERPEMVRKVIDKALKDGVADTMKMVFQRLDSPVALGYSCAGIVLDVGQRVRGFAVGDRVACAGQNYASHAEVVAVPRNLCVAIPDGVDFEDAAYVTLGAIAMQGVRQAEPRLGETVAVIGLGLLGQLVVQMLRANGCQVLATDIAADKLALARSFGADQAVSPAELLDAAMALTGGHGVDAVIIAASTRENSPVEAAAQVCRKKGRVVVLGAVGMDLPREPFYAKELELRLSTSYGPGRYDPEYEEKGHDYPYGYVRWTEARNMAAFLWLVREGKVNCKALTSHRFGIEQGEAAYQIDHVGRRAVSRHCAVLSRCRGPHPRRAGAGGPARGERLTRRIAGPDRRRQSRARHAAAPPQGTCRRGPALDLHRHRRQRQCAGRTLRHRCAHHQLPRGARRRRGQRRADRHPSRRPRPHGGRRHCRRASTSSSRSPCASARRNSTR